jgi:hypothetical protein
MKLFIINGHVYHVFMYGGYSLYVRSSMFIITLNVIGLLGQRKSKPLYSIGFFIIMKCKHTYT